MNKRKAGNDYFCYLLKGTDLPEPHTCDTVLAQKLPFRDRPLRSKSLAPWPLPPTSVPTVHLTLAGLERNYFELPCTPFCVMETCRCLCRVKAPLPSASALQSPHTGQALPLPCPSVGHRTVSSVPNLHTQFTLHTACKNSP